MISFYALVYAVVEPIAYESTLSCQKKFGVNVNVTAYVGSLE